MVHGTLCLSVLLDRVAMQEASIRARKRKAAVSARSVVSEAARDDKQDEVCARFQARPNKSAPKRNNAIRGFQVGARFASELPAKMRIVSVGPVRVTLQVSDNIRHTHSLQHFAKSTTSLQCFQSVPIHPLVSRGITPPCCCMHADNSLIQQRVSSESLVFMCCAQP